MYKWNCEELSLFVIILFPLLVLGNPRAPRDAFGHHKTGKLPSLFVFTWNFISLFVGALILIARGPHAGTGLEIACVLVELKEANLSLCGAGSRPKLS